MGSIIEINDTLQLTRKQGFPKELKLEKHLKNPYQLKNFKNKTFQFKKPDIRIFHSQPVRNFLVENRSGKWIYWGLIHILEISHNYLTKTTSGKFKIIYIYKPDEMEIAYNLIDRRKDKNFWK